MQADFLKMLYDKMTELHMKHADSPEEWRYPLPSFKVNADADCSGIWPRS